MFRNFLFCVLLIGFSACDGPQTQVQNGGAEAYVIKKGDLENPNARGSRSRGGVGVLCIEGKMYAYYHEQGRDGGVGLAAVGETCPDIDITKEDSTSQQGE